MPEGDLSPDTWTCTPPMELHRAPTCSRWHAAMALLQASDRDAAAQRFHDAQARRTAGIADHLFPGTTP